MEQLGLFALMEDDLSQVEFWTAGEFVRLLQDGRTDTFVEAMKKYGFSESIATRIANVRPDFWKSLVEAAITLHSKPIPKLVLEATPEAYQINLQNPIFSLLSKCTTDTIGELKRDVLTNRLRGLVGEWIWYRAPYQSYTKPENWLNQVTNILAYQNLISELKAEQISPTEVRKGDILFGLTFGGYPFKGVVLGGEIRKYKDGTSFGGLDVWAQEWFGKDASEDGFRYSQQGSDDYLAWMANHPVLKELSSRQVVGTHGKEFYRIGHIDNLESYQVPNDIVVEALQSLPLPETPEAFWSYMSWNKHDFINYYHSEAIHDALYYHMTRFDLSHVLRLLENHNPKLPRRGSQYDRLPPDEMIDCMVDKLVEANSVAEVEDILNTHFWVTRSPYHRMSYSVCMTDSSGCYKGAYVAGLAQSKDRDTIVKILQSFAVNAGNVGAGVAKYTPEDGFVIEPKSPDLNPYFAAKYDRVVRAITEGTFLGVFDESTRSAVADEDDEDDVDTDNFDEELEEQDFDDEEEFLEMEQDGTEDYSEAH